MQNKKFFRGRNWTLSLELITLSYLGLEADCRQGEGIDEVLLLYEVELALLQQGGLPLLRLVLVEGAVRLAAVTLAGIAWTQMEYTGIYKQQPL